MLANGAVDGRRVVPGSQVFAITGHQVDMPVIFNYDGPDS